MDDLSIDKTLSMTLCLGCFIMWMWWKQCLQVLDKGLLVHVLENIKQSPTHTQKHACINITMEEQHIEATQWMQQTQYCNLNCASPPCICHSFWQRTHQHWLTQQTPIHVQDNHKQTAIHLQTNNNTFTNIYNTSKHCKPLPRVCGSAMVSQLAGIGGSMCTIIVCLIQAYEYTCRHAIPCMYMHIHDESIAMFEETNVNTHRYMDNHAYWHAGQIWHTDTHTDRTDMTWQTYICVYIWWSCWLRVVCCWFLVVGC